MDFIIPDPTPEQIAAIHRIAAHLEGSAQTEDLLVAEEHALAGISPEIVLHWLDHYGQIFPCASCGWCSADELGEDGESCRECEEDDEEEDQG